MLTDDPNQSAKKISVWSDDDHDKHAMEVRTLWKNQEHTFFNKIQMHYNNKSIESGSYERLDFVDEIHLYVTERLSEIAFNQADLIKHLRLFKDYFLLGRGELFLEFIKQLKNIKSVEGIKTENLTRDISLAFQKALSRITTIDSSDHITVHIAECNNMELNGMGNVIKLIRLSLNVKWPLHLFFSPLVLQKYNELFNFLLQIRFTQDALHDVWRVHREKKVMGNCAAANLRNRMLFLIDNLQYYLQVDVLESQFCVLINTVQHSKNFEFMQRAHSIFQANVMSLSFLLNTGTAQSSIDVNTLNTTLNNIGHRENPVFTILNKILTTIQSFCSLNQLSEDQSDQLDFLAEQ